MKIGREGEKVRGGDCRVNKYFQFVFYLFDDNEMKKVSFELFSVIKVWSICCSLCTKKNNIIRSY